MGNLILVALTSGSIANGSAISWLSMFALIALLVERCATYLFDDIGYERRVTVATLITYGLTIVGIVFIYIAIFGFIVNGFID